MLKVLQLCFLIKHIFAAPILNENELAKNHLMKYMYLNEEDVKNETIFKEAVKRYQNDLGLESTGILDEATTNLMKMPRCGPLKQSGTTKKWEISTLNYKIELYPTRNVNFSVDNVFRDAFNIWQQYANVKFQPVKIRQSLKILFAKGNHGDDNYFDGPLNVLAHAYYPVKGEVHFDDEDNWSNSDEFINLYQIAAHEIGHAIGLRHISNNKSVMYPNYIYNAAFRHVLFQEEVEKVQELYGPPVNLVNQSDVCEAAEAPDVIFKAQNDSIYLLKSDRYWIFNTNKELIHEGFISSIWEHAPHNIDAAFESTLRYTFLFKGKQVWKYAGAKLQSGFPKFIYESFRGIPSNIDSVTIWKGKLVFTKFYSAKRSETWTYDRENGAQNTSIKDIWPMRPKNINSVLNLNNGTVIVFGLQRYYVSDDWGETCVSKKGKIESYFNITIC